MNKTVLPFLVLFCLPLVGLKAQNITHGPAVGGITENLARIYIRTHQASAIEIQYSTDSLFSTFFTVPDSTKPELDSSTIVLVPFLQPDTRYFFRIAVAGVLDSIIGSFRTFPTEGTPSNLKFVIGSCQETPNMKVFDVIDKHRPNMFLHLGDWTYPSYQQNNDYPTQYPAVQLSWKRKYEEIRMKEMLHNVPIDYINDDDDGWGGSKYIINRSYYDTVDGQLVNFLEGDSIPEIQRTNVKRAYMEYFPGYNIADTSVALHHSFKAGNCEFFFVDTRNDKDCENDAFTYLPDSNKWYFTPDTGHKVMSHAQMNWLKSGLAASTADWKFIVGGIPFNKNMRRLIEIGLRLQGTAFQLGEAGVNSTGFHLALGFADYWSGYPASQTELLNHIQANNIKDVVFLSGDTHHNVMDDGTNGGLPEVNASGLSVTGTFLAYYLNLYAPVFGEPSLQDSMWNQGGNGLGNMNFKNAFGEVNVYGRDSLGLCIVDEDDTAISCFTLINSRILGEKELTESAVAMKIFPVPAYEKLFIEIADNYDARSLIKVEVYDFSGRKIQETKEYSGLLMVDTEQLALGAYFIKTNYKGQILSKKFIKQ